MSPLADRAREVLEDWDGLVQTIKEKVLRAVVVQAEEAARDVAVALDDLAGGIRVRAFAAQGKQLSEVVA